MTMVDRSPAADPELAAEALLHMYRRMASIRLFEERVNDLYTRALMPGLAHLYIGEEAVAVGVCETLRTDDYITSTHRGHGHCLAKGATPRLMFAELLGKRAGYCKGKGGSMHIADPDTGNLGANAIVGGSAALATGAAFSSKYLKLDRLRVREQLVQRVHPLHRDNGGRHPGAAGGIRAERRERRRPGRTRRLRHDGSARRARAAR